MQLAYKQKLHNDPLATAATITRARVANPRKFPSSLVANPLVANSLVANPTNFPSSFQGTMITFKLKYHISLESDLPFQPKALNLFISTVKVPWHFDNIDNITFSARVRYKLGYCLHTDDIHTWANGWSLASCRR